MTRIIRSAEPDALFHEEAGCVVPPRGTDLCPLLLIARCGPLGMKADGSLVRILREEEWPDGLFGEWEEINGKGLSLDQAVNLVEGVEAMLLLPAHTLDMENLWLVCQVWAQATQLNALPLRIAIERVLELHKVVDHLHQQLTGLRERVEAMERRGRP